MNIYSFNIKPNKYPLKTKRVCFPLTTTPSFIPHKMKVYETTNREPRCTKKNAIFLQTFAEHILYSIQTENNRNMNHWEQIKYRPLIPFTTVKYVISGNYIIISYHRHFWDITVADHILMMYRRLYIQCQVSVFAGNTGELSLLQKMVHVCV